MEPKSPGNFTQAKYDERNDERPQGPVLGRASAATQRKIDRGKGSENETSLEGRKWSTSRVGDGSLAAELGPNKAQKF